MCSYIHSKSVELKFFVNEKSSLIQKRDDNLFISVRRMGSDTASYIYYINLNCIEWGPRRGLLTVDVFLDVERMSSQIFI